MRIAIASGKGGTGKTTLSVNLARYASLSRRTLLADLDVEEPNSGVFIGGRLITEKEVFRQVPSWEEKRCTLCGKCSEYCKFNAALKLGGKIVIMPELCHSCYACSELCPENALPMVSDPHGTIRHYQSDTLNFIEGRLNIGEEQAPPLIRETIKYTEHLNCSFELEFWDSPPGTSCPVITATSEADLVILVTEPTPFGLYDLQLAVETMKKLGKQTAVIVNRVGIGNEELFSYCAEQNLSVWATIPDSREIAELYSMGELIYPKIKEYRDSLDVILQRISELESQQCVKS